MTELTLTTTLEPFGPATAIILTDAQVEQLGGGKRAPVTVTVDGRTTRVRLTVMGGRNCIGLSTAARAELGVDLGDTVTATVGLDEATREVVVPPELAQRLARDTEAARVFDGLAFTHRKEYATWVGEAKQSTTRERRAERALEMIRAGQTRS